MVTYPKDWREKTFNAFLKIKRGASPRPIESYLTSNIGGVNWIKIGDAPRYGKYITSTEEKITTMGAAHSVRVFPGDFILSNSMSFGRPYILSIAGCIHDGWLRLYDFQAEADDEFLYYLLFATVYKGNIIKNLIMDCQSYTKYRPNETTGGIFVSWRRKEELPTGA